MIIYAAAPLFSSPLICKQRKADRINLRLEVADTLVIKIGSFIQKSFIAHCIKYTDF